jgi:hypothetical protein
LVIRTSAANYLIRTRFWVRLQVPATTKTQNYQAVSRKSDGFFRFRFLKIV